MNEIVVCPICKEKLSFLKNEIKCSICNRRFQYDNGIPLIFQPHDTEDDLNDVTDKMKSFYEKTPFPDYNDFENIGDLFVKAYKRIFARLLNEQLPFNIRILEAGCGTGQLSNFLGISQGYVNGSDMCLSPL